MNRDLKETRTNYEQEKILGIKQHDPMGNHQAKWDLLNRGTQHKKSGGDALWIQSAIKHPGALHEELHIAEGKKIPLKRLNKATHSKDPAIRKQASLAKTLRSFHSHKGG